VLPLEEFHVLVLYFLPLVAVEAEEDKPTALLELHKVLQVVVE
jgi:hypothetical protein